ncbi:Hypothetical predicted protein [Lecanosticta acicola]|uniref:Uncharacterized protein n=1 Tax=Lecanosticta acicola TaxID=111012 RepID=A0AAI8YYU0_9PEZI|nr:Hypothetical predicted protein [Lecanosticta acicola]
MKKATDNRSKEPKRSTAKNNGKQAAGRFLISRPPQPAQPTNSNVANAPKKRVEGKKKSAPSSGSVMKHVSRKYENAKGPIGKDASRPMMGTPNDGDTAPVKTPRVKTRCRPKDRPAHARVVACKDWRQRMAEHWASAKTAAHEEQALPSKKDWQPSSVPQLPTPTSSPSSVVQLIATQDSTIHQTDSPQPEHLYIVLVASCQYRALLRYEVDGIFRSVSDANRAAASRLETECHPQKPFENMRNLHFRASNEVPWCDGEEGQKWFSSATGGVHFCYNKGNGGHVRVYVDRQMLRPAASQHNNAMGR